MSSYTTELYFKAFVDYDVYFDETIGEGLDRVYWLENNGHF